MIKCQFCSFFSKRYLKLHMEFEHHTHFSHVKYSCRFKNCDRSYSDYQTLVKHQRRCKHLKGAVLESDSEKPMLDVTKQSENSFNDTIQVNFEIFPKTNLKKPGSEIENINNKIESDNNTICDKNLDDTESEQNNLHIFAMKMISSLQSDAALSRIQINRIMQLFHVFLNTNYINNLKKSISFIESPNSSNIIEQFEILQNVFSNLDSEYKRNKLLTNLGYYIKPARVFFGTMEEKNENVLKTVNVYGQLIPLKEILKIFFEIPNVFEKIYKYITTLNENTDDEICNIVQTSFWKSKILNNESITFPLFLYEDAFETANPLGSHAGIYKLCGMYISIPCLPPELSSRLDNIFLAQLYHADDTKLFSKKQIYSYLIRDLMILETEGIQLSIGSKNIQVYFKLALIIGDNLRLHGILGFVESFSANLCCRFCKISKDISRKPCSEDINLLRNKINYAQDIAINKVTITGLKESCAFNVLKSFHAVENYSVDIMHDLLESTRYRCI